MPALAGHLRVAADAEVAERGPVEPRQDERLVPGRARPGVDVDERERRPERARPGGRSRRGSRRPPGWPSQQSVATRSATTCSFASRASTPTSRQRRSQAGSVGLRSFCQKPGPPAPSGKRWRLSGRSARCGSMHRGDPGEVADELALRDRPAGVARRAGGKSGLSRLVSFRSTPPIAPDALTAEPVERGELLVRGGPRVEVGRRSGAAVWRRSAVRGSSASTASTVGRALDGPLAGHLERVAARPRSP